MEKSEGEKKRPLGKKKKKKKKTRFYVKYDNVIRVRLVKAET